MTEKNHKTCETNNLSIQTLYGKYQTRDERQVKHISRTGLIKKRVPITNQQKSYNTKIN